MKSNNPSQEVGKTIKAPGSWENNQSPRKLGKQSKPNQEVGTVASAIRDSFILQPYAP